MRLWHEKFIPVLPKQMLVSQWRELIAIKRQWEKGTLQHRLVSYVKKYPKSIFLFYTLQVAEEMKIRKIRYQEKYLQEIKQFCKGEVKEKLHYPEQNNRYLKQCYYNLQEKCDRGIISKTDFNKIEGIYLDDQHPLEK